MAHGSCLPSPGCKQQSSRTHCEPGCWCPSPSRVAVCSYPPLDTLVCTRPLPRTTSHLSSTSKAKARIWSIAALASTSLARTLTRIAPLHTELDETSSTLSRSHPSRTALPFSLCSLCAAAVPQPAPFPPFSCQGARAIPAQRALRGCCLPTAPFFQWAGSRAPLWEELPLGIGADDEFCGTRGLDEGKPRGSA